MSTPIYLDIRIPIITARVLLITTTVLSIVFGVLLPFSFLSFNYFYHVLIPIPNVELPLSNYILNYDFSNIPPFVIIGKTLTPLYANQPKNELDELLRDFNFDLNYDFKLKFNAFCQDDVHKYETIMYKTSIVSTHLVDQLSPYGTRAYIPKKFHLWPLTNNIHQLNNPQVLVSAMNTLILNCHDDNDYRKGVPIGELFPPVLNWFLPPLLSNSEINSKDSRFELDLLSNVKLSDYITHENSRFFKDGGFNILLEFNKPNVIIDPSKSEISINTAWKGLRYYLYHYRILSYIIGTTSLWLTSSFILASTVSGLVLWRESTTETEQTIFEGDDGEEELEPIVLKGDYQKGFTGRDHNQNFNFKIDINEEINI